MRVRVNDRMNLFNTDPFEHGYDNPCANVKPIGRGRTGYATAINHDRSAIGCFYDDGFSLPDIDDPHINDAKHIPTDPKPITYNDEHDTDNNQPTTGIGPKGTAG